MTDTRCTTCPRFVPDVAFGCPACGADLAQRLDELAAILPEVGVTVAKQDRIGSGGARAAGAEVPLPYNDGAADCGRAIQGELVTWARVVHAETGRRLPAMPSGSALARYLGQSVPWLRYQQAWPEVHAALRPLTGSALRLVDRPADRVYLGPCSTPQPDGPTCRADVYARPGAATGTCKACETVHDVAESREWLLGALEDTLMRPVEMAGILQRMGVKVGYSTITMYAQQRRFLPHGHDTRMRPIYRLGDVLAAIKIAEQERLRRTSHRPRSLTNR